MTKLNDPILVAGWPGIGGVAVAAASYLAEKNCGGVGRELDGMEEYFFLDRAQVTAGVIRPAHAPWTKVFTKARAKNERDLAVVVSESQPSCRPTDYARTVLEGVSSTCGRPSLVVTFAALVVPKFPRDPSGVHLFATSQPLLSWALDRCGASKVSDTHVAGMNGVLLAEASRLDLPGVGIMVEVPAMAVGVPYMKASLAGLKAFGAISGIRTDLTDLTKHAQQIESGLSEALDRMRSLHSGPADDDDSSDEEPALPSGLPEDVEARIEGLFSAVAADRSRALELKAELDQHGVFKKYEDRFLDLFNGGQSA